MTDRLNRTSICSIVFLDIIDYSRKPVSEQIEDKTFFNELINEAIKDVAQNDRIILDTGDGAAIALMGAPEEALFVSLTIRDGILEYNKSNNQYLLVRIGINLGSVRVVKDINGRPNIIGDGINVAQRIMSFAGENQILVSRSYYEVTSRLTREITEMFTYSGIKQDKHIREHEVYLIKPKESDAIKIAESGLASATAAYKTTNSHVSDQLHKRSSLILFTGIGLLAGVVVWLFLDLQFKPDNVMKQANTEVIVPAISSKPTSVLEAAKNTARSKQKKTREIVEKPLSQDKQAINKPTSKKSSVKEQNLTQPKQACTQAELALNQCH